ncbi:O-Antigen ligase [Devosia lucknowensis]|uniref:O-Antigen ligase n=1 Tax=Devosia lucknowensis TaxID=1096929 RepID=A0A1Y6GB79_9HYPH|nr:O-antigen ligase family protein [Devosia lucknowensis]SMQ85717.1 O-Antigen ligase [Devosia lucknowensis]
MDATAFKDAPLRWKVASVLSGVFVVASLCLWATMGNTGAYVALLLAVPALLTGLTIRGIANILKARWVWALISGFVLISAAFLLQPERASAASIGDFALFALAPLLAVAVMPFARRVSVEITSWIFLLATVLCAWIGISGILGGGGRVSAPELSPIHFADLALIAGFAALAGVLRARPGYAYVLYLAPVLGLVAAIASGTRASMLAALVLVVVYALFWLRERRWPVIGQVALFAGIIALTLAAFFLANALGFTRPLGAIEPVLAVLRGELPADHSSIYRVEMYRSAVAAFWDAPLVGHGWHNQLQAAYPYLSEMAKAGYEAEAWSYIHSDFLSLAVAAGVFGALAYLAFIAAPLIAAWEGDRGLKAGPRLYLAVTVSLGLFVSGLTDVLFMVEAPKLLLVVVSAIVFFAPSKSAAAP